MAYLDAMKSGISLCFAVLLMLSGGFGAVHAQTYGTHYVYDDYGRLLETITQDYESRTVNTLNTNGWVTFVRTYDAKNTVDTGDDVLLTTNETVYRANGQKEEARGADCFNASDTYIGPDCARTTYSYDTVGRPEFTKVKADSLTAADDWRITKQEYDVAGQLLKVIRAHGSAIQQDYQTYEYTLNGKQASVMDAKGNVTKYWYNDFDQLEATYMPPPAILCGEPATACSTTNPNEPDDYSGSGGHLYADYEELTYDKNGNILTKRTRNNKLLTTTYDALNQIVSKTPEGEATVSFIYDKVGNQLSATFSGTIEGKVTTTYDGAYRAATSAQVLNGVTYTVTSDYDDNGNRSYINLPGGVGTAVMDITFAYDLQNRVSAITEVGGATLAAYSYDRLSRRTLFARGTTSNRYTSYTYGVNLALSQFNHQSLLGGATDLTYDHSYLHNGQMDSRSISDPAFVWMPPQDGTEGYTSNGLNQYTVVDGKAQTHDGNGSMLTYDGWAYTYSVENQLKSASKGGVTTAFTYDAVGRRISKTVDDGVIVDAEYYLSDGTEEVADYDDSGTIKRRYVNGSGVDERLAYYTYDGSGTQLTQQYYFTDHQGSVVALTDSTGNETDTFSYDAFGIPSDGNGNPFKYTGRRWDNETGLYYYRARYYHPTLGRFLQTDPIGYQDQMNLYTYVGNDPINNTDPTGECSMSSTDTDALTLICGVAVGIYEAGIDLIDPTEDIEEITTAVQNGDVVGVATAVVAAVVKPAKIAKKVTKSLKKTSKVGDKVKTPDSHASEFTKRGDGAQIDQKTGHVFKKSNTNHKGDSKGEWKVGTKKGKEPTKKNKITVTRSDCKITKKDGC